jgi:hypothetical protein
MTRAAITESVVSRRLIVGGLPLTMRFTRNKGLLQQLKTLRESLYGIDERFVGFRIFQDDETSEPEEDAADQIVVVHDDAGKVYGGACLRVATPEHPIMMCSELDVLPAEGKFYYSFREDLPHLELDKYAYAEAVRFVIEPSLRTGVVGQAMRLMIAERCIKHRIRYVFCVGDRGRARFYKQVCRTYGEGHFWDIAMREEFEGVAMQLICGDCRPFWQTPEDPEAMSLLSPNIHFEFDDRELTNVECAD